MFSHITKPVVPDVILYGFYCVAYFLAYSSVLRHTFINKDASDVTDQSPIILNASAIRGWSCSTHKDIN